MLLYALREIYRERRDEKEKSSSKSLIILPPMLIFQDKFVLSAMLKLTTKHVMLVNI